jgi:hypothetical protein
MIEALFLVIVFVAVPIWFALAEGPGSMVPNLALAAGLALAAAFALPAGLTAGVLAAPWALMTAFIAIDRLRGLAAGARRPGGVADRIVVDAAVAFLAVGGGAVFVSRLGLQPFGFGEPIVLLTGVHFHVAGFVLPMAGYRLRREWPGRVISTALAALLIGIPTTAIGFLGAAGLNFVGGLLVAGAGFVVGYGHLAIARAHEGSARTLLSVAGLSLLLSMPLAAAWATTSFLAIPFLPIAVMAAAHGGLNVLGFAVPGTLAWRSIDRLDDGRVERVAVPKRALDLSQFDRIDHSDAYRVRVPAGIDVATAARAFLTAPPRWVVALVRLRDRMVTPLRLKAVGWRAPDPSTFSLFAGARGGLFPVIGVEPESVILGEDDRHLDFRIRLDIAGEFLTVSTVVRFHGWLGKLYFRPIQPVHDLIFRATLEQTRRRLFDAAVTRRRAA